MKKYILFAGLFVVSFFSFIFVLPSSSVEIAPEIEAWATNTAESYDSHFVAGNQKETENRKPAAAGPAFVSGAKGEKKLVITLKYYCSSWLFLRFMNEPNSPETINARECAMYASRSTDVAQRVFNNSKIPVHFISTWSVEPSHYRLLLGKNSTSKTDRIAAVNGAALPVFKVLDADIKYTSVPAVAPVIGKPAKIEANLASCSPFGLPNCGDNRSTVTVTNWQWKWGAAKPAVTCGSSFCSTRGWPETSFVYNQLAYDSCRFDCACVHWANDKTTWENPASGCVSGYNYGPWPGPPLELARNSCGCLVVSTPAVPAVPGSPDASYWESAPKAQFPLKAQTQPFTEALTWLKNKNFLPPPGDHSITIAVSPYMYEDSKGTRLLGLTYAGVDYTTKVRELAETMSAAVFPGLTPQNYLSQNALIVTAINSPTELTVAHEIGHVFGAQHEIFTLVNSDWFRLNNYEKRTVGAYANLDEVPNYGTIMSVGSFYKVPYFSTPFFKPSPSDYLAIPTRLPIGESKTDNRSQIVGTLSYLAGQDLEYERPFLREVLNIIQNFLSGE